MKRSISQIGGLLLATLVAGGAYAQLESPSDVYLNVSEDARKRLEQVDSYVEDGQWVEAVELLQNLIEQYPDKVIPASSDNPEHFLNARTVCHQKIANLPEQALRMYRERVDGPAADLWQRAQDATGNERLELLRRIADEFFCSSVGGKAVEQLGDLAMSQGDYVQALYRWSQLLAPREGDQFRVPRPLFRFPTPAADQARLMAKCAVAELFRGNLTEAVQQNNLLKEKFPDAAGKLAGKDGPYSETIQTLINEAQVFKPAPPRPEYHTFAGTFSRSHVAPKPVDIGLVQWQWEVEKPDPRPNPNRTAFFGAPSEDALPYFPVIVGTQVHLATGQYLWTFDLQTGKAESWYNFEDDGLAARGRGDAVVPHSLTVDGDQLFVRAGSSPQISTMRNFHRPAIGAVSKLYCFDHKHQKQLWVKDSGDFGDKSFTFEGAPILRGPYAYIAMTRSDATIETNLVCLERDTGELRWRTYICSTHDVLAEQPANHDLLTLGGDTIYYSTNLGAVAAVDAMTGRLKWVTKYRRREAFGRQVVESTHPIPAVYDNGRLFVAAGDTEKLQCFDALTGEKIWDAPPRIDHLLGVVDGVLVATGDRVWGINVQTGKRMWAWPENDVTGYGRGVLAGNYVYWPTINQIHVLDHQTGRVARPPIALYDRLHTTGGNLILGDGYLLIAQARRLVALFPYSRLIEKLQKQLVENPRAPELHMKIAQAAFNNEDYTLASKHFGLGAEHASPTHVLDGQPLVELARLRRHESLVRIAEKLKSDAKWDAAQAHYRQAAESAPDAKHRVESLFALSAMWQTAKRPAEAVAVLQSILDDPANAAALTLGEQGQQLPAAISAASQIESILASEGRELYKPMEAELARLRNEAADPQEMAALAERFPNSVHRLDVLLAAGDMFLTKQRYREARVVFKQTLFHPDSSKDSIFQALKGLQQSYQEMGLVQPEFVVLDRLQKEFASRPAEPYSTVSQWVQARRTQLAAAAALSQPRDMVVVDKGWRKDASAGVFRIPSGQPPSKLHQGLVRVHEGKVAFCAPEDGRDLWETPLEGVYVWSAFTAAGLLIGTSETLACHGYESGNANWSWKVPHQQVDAWRSVEEQSEEAKNAEQSPAIEVAYALAGDTALCVLQDRLVAIDSDRGTPIWETGDPIDPAAPVQAAGARLCVRGPDTLRVLNVLTGAKVFDVRILGADRADVTLSDGMLYVTSKRDEVAAFDLATGENIWTSEHRLPNLCWPSLYPAEDSVIVVHDGKELRSLNRKDGSLQWTARLQTRAANWNREQAVLQGEQFVYTCNGWLESRRLSDGGLRWRFPLPNLRSMTAPNLVGQVTLLSGEMADDLYLVAVNTQTGAPSQLLRFPDLKGDASIELAAANGLLTAQNGTWTLDWQPESTPQQMGGTND